MIEQTRSVKIERVDFECTDTKSLYFKDNWIKTAEPGQYIMVWIPAVDEVPMSISAINTNGCSRITIKVMGYTTRVLTSMETGERIGVRGPFGNSYDQNSKRPLLVAGGSGMASLMPLVQHLTKNKIVPTVMLGARSVDQLLFVNELEHLLGDKLVITTDDGSKGYTGYASGYAAKLIESNDFDVIYTCGPELMIAKVFDAAEQNNILVQASLERYIKCAAGLCGACAIGPYRVCKDGPIFSSSKLREVREELGVSKMDPSGKKIRVDH